MLPFRAASHFIIGLVALQFNMYDSVVTQQEEIHRGHATIISTHQKRQGIAAAEDPTNEELLASGAVRQYLETTEGRRLYAQYTNATEKPNTTEDETHENTENTENENTENETNENTENETPRTRTPRTRPTRTPRTKPTRTQKRTPTHQRLQLASHCHRKRNVTPRNIGSSGQQ